MIMERKIGEIFEYNGEWYQCVESSGCAPCVFNETDCRDIDTGSCDEDSRSDGKSIVFKNLKKIGEPFYRRWTLEGNNKLMQRYKTYTTPLITIDKQEVFYNLTNDLLEIEIKQHEMKEVNNPNLSNTEKIGKNLKPFSLEAAKLGKPVCTRDGRNARIICFDSKNDPQRPIIALVENNSNELLYEYTIEGKERFSHISTTGTSDLMMFPEKKEGWIVIRRSDIYENEEQAKEVLLNSHTAMMVRKITWEE